MSVIKLATKENIRREAMSDILERFGIEQGFEAMVISSGIVHALYLRDKGLSAGMAVCEAKAHMQSTQDNLNRVLLRGMRK